MIVFKNNSFDLEENLYIPMKFKINETTLTLTKKIDDIYETIQSFSTSDNQNQSQIIQISIPNLIHPFPIFHQNEEQSEHRKNKESFNNKSKIINDTYVNEVFLKSDISLITKKYSVKDKALNIALEQLQLFFDGYDIIIPDFLVNDMMIIAEKLKMHKLIEELNPLNEEILNNKDYDKISELEILIKFEKELLTINEENFKEKSSIIYSLYLYIGQKFFQIIIDSFIRFREDKKAIYFQICEMICLRFPEFENSFNEIKMNSNAYSTIEKVQNTIFYDFIMKDDVDSLQKQISTQKLDITKEIFYLPRNDKCNAIECAAFFGSLKCFKYLLLNFKFYLNSVANYAVKGGNAEIIHICHQKKCRFKGTLLKAIYNHQNEIAKWILDNKIDDDYNLDSCVDSCNFEMLQYIINLKTPEINNIIMIKYIIYVYQYYNVDAFHQTYFTLFLMRFDFKNLKNNDNYGLMYCPNGKVIILLRYLYNLNNKMKDECSFFIFMHFPISISFCSIF